jgi:predicted nucleic acid-binding protein
LVPGDTADNRILECVVAADAGTVVTGDKHLLALGDSGGTAVMRVADFMRLATENRTG